MEYRLPFIIKHYQGVGGLSECMDDNRSIGNESAVSENEPLEAFLILA